MGNCLTKQIKVIKVIKTDGNVLEYKAPMKVHQVLSEFSGHALSDTLSVSRHLQPDTEMLRGHLYYLLPLPNLQTSPKVGKKKKKVRFSDEEVEGDGTVVRIKMVITKQELMEMLRKGGVAVDGAICSQLLQDQKKQSMINGKFDDDDDDDDDDDGGGGGGGGGGGDGISGNCSGWKPLLESIPEVGC